MISVATIPGAMIRYDDVDQNAQRTGTIEGRRLFDLKWHPSEEGREQPEGNGDVGKAIEEHEAGMGVEEPVVLSR